MTFLFDDDVSDGLSHLLTHLGHRVTFLREVLARDTPDDAVLAHAVQHGFILVTCNRDDFIRLARERPHHGIVVVIRRRSRAQERAALLRLLEAARNQAWPTTSSSHDSRAIIVGLAAQPVRLLLPMIPVRTSPSADLVARPSSRGSAAPARPSRSTRPSRGERAGGYREAADG